MVCLPGHVTTESPKSPHRAGQDGGELLYCNCAIIIVSSERHSRRQLNSINTRLSSCISCTDDVTMDESDVK